jgi:hypothetical protein
MKTRYFVYLLLLIVFAFTMVLFTYGEEPTVSVPEALTKIIARSIPKPPPLQYSIWRTAPLIVAEVFGRAQGCSDASPELIETITRAAIYANLDPSIAAATVATESACNPYAISPRGAIGLMQVRISTWRGSYDFAGTVNMFNAETNVRVGSEIEAQLIEQYGVVDGIHRYNGTGTECGVDCDANYSARILSLAHK